MRDKLGVCRREAAATLLLTGATCVPAQPPEHFASEISVSMSSGDRHLKPSARLRDVDIARQLFARACKAPERILGLVTPT